MDYHEALEIAHNETEVIRQRKNLLYTFGSTRLPYICLCGQEEIKDAVTVRYGEVTANKPQIAIPGQEMSFEGFDFDGQEDDGLPVFLARRIEMPAAKYVNTEGEVRIERGGVDAAAERAFDELEGKNDIRTAVIRAPESVWQLSILLYIGSQVARSAESNISEHMERMIRQQGL